MSNWQTSQIVFLSFVVLYTLAAAISDLRTRRIPNRMTVPMFVAGLVYQVWFFGLEGLGHGAAGFATGFGILFVLWMIGSAGGGDVKLLGGLSVWLGTGLTLKVLLCSLMFVVVGTGFLLLQSLLMQGFRKTRNQYVKGAAGPAKSGTAETSEQRAGRRVMAFAAPVALATWCVLALFRTQW
ncbi:MAG: prepilin peptidase [Planctomyces sp.]